MLSVCGFVVARNLWAPRNEVSLLRGDPVQPAGVQESSKGPGLSPTYKVRSYSHLHVSRHFSQHSRQPLATMGCHPSPKIQSKLEATITAPAGGYGGWGGERKHIKGMPRDIFTWLSLIPFRAFQENNFHFLLWQQLYVSESHELLTWAALLWQQLKSIHSVYQKNPLICLKKKSFAIHKDRLRKLFHSWERYTYDIDACVIIYLMCSSCLLSNHAVSMPLHI